ncbi:hypothetical protein OVY48_06730 [Sphingobium sp. SA2]|uniref:hypothetical protein n=1 Tax=Sphingobium sp. SA2 TaxID=1524832 RepID=UPI0028C0F4DF|nr:hypothetical protein [Sphingobium sp. SA2]MDT7533128.1 hypothetical protein [Sphingobium sp. SA2]
MNQSFDTQLQVVLRALGEVVLPALGGAEKHVVEQLHLSMAALTLMSERLPHARRFYRGELLVYGALADAVADIIGTHAPSDADDLRSFAQSARTLLQSATAEWTDYIDATRDLRARVAGVTERSAGAPYEQALDQLVIATSTDLHLQSRLWCLPFGFELKPEDLPKPAWLGQAEKL